MATEWVGSEVGTVSFNGLSKDIATLNILIFANIPTPDI